MSKNPVDAEMPRTNLTGLKHFPEWAIVAIALVPSQVIDQQGPLKLLISIERQAIPSPLPARVTLHFHNAGKDPLWLYRPVAPYLTGQGMAGSSVQVQLEREKVSGASDETTPAQGRVLKAVGLPHPKLFRIAPGDDAEERTVIHLSPAILKTAAGDQALWGWHRLGIRYSAAYPNGEELGRVLGFQPWKGETTSNVVEIEILPPAGTGTAAGAVVGKDSRPISGTLVSLTDREERLVDQISADDEGRFSFGHLPFELYWVTARIETEEEDTAVFRHVELTPDQPAGSTEIVMYPRENYQPNQFLHKPVLVLVRDSQGRPLANVRLEMTWSNGTVMDRVKAETGGDGQVAVELLPGRNFLTLKRKGCRDEDRLADVAEGGGIDGFEFTYNCPQN